jgi:hypothetical protein
VGALEKMRPCARHSGAKRYGSAGRLHCKPSPPKGRIARAHSHGTLSVTHLTPWSASGPSLSELISWGMAGVAKQNSAVHRDNNRRGQRKPRPHQTNLATTSRLV